MRSRRLSVSLPEPVLDALYAEGSRTYETPGQVAARVLREALPAYVERRLRRDLAPVVRARVLDVRSTPIWEPDARLLPQAPVSRAVTGGTFELTTPPDQVVAALPGDGCTPEPGVNARPT